ncbi:unnamed protein product [Kuraishia capsulata CBS 1993]|uniref:Autophagy-related protein 2 n=1 Tax=Kuraishia capsulata CBS 1993 TaxID=1382522 RepID=W6MJ05_9ASCO|nr:uncharacterized protein KUCA_T00001899001 [Kuraishia capsulata CBS 1993]CDK25928.1 unnamed protein product [Kuraishia capsulata CBS 1993]
MAPQWMPQNLQKRLLRYVLQQLSLFSEINLPNLDVSIGTNSRVNLRDVQLDPEKISLPGIYVRDGRVKDLTLVLTVSDGVNIEADGVDVTLAPSATTTRGTESPRGHFSLAQSTADFANSVMFADEAHEPDIKSLQDSLDIPNEEKDDQKGETYLGNMMNRAVEIALSRLQVELRNIKITIILDGAVVEVLVAHLWFASEDGIRKIDFEGVEVLLVKPATSGGDMGEHSDDSKSEEADTSTRTDTSETDSEDDMDMDELERSGLMDSVLFEQQGDSSMYMSATSNVILSGVKPAASERERTKPARIMYIKDGSFSFKGLQDIEKLVIEIGTINVALTPWPTALASIFDSLSRLVKLAKIQKRREASRESDTSPESTASDENRFPVDRVSISEIVLSFTSAILSSGEFADPSSLRAVIGEVLFSQKKKPSFHGIIRSLEILKGIDEKVFSFETNQEVSNAAGDIRFESIQSDITRYTLLCSKPATCNLDLASLSIILRFYFTLEPFFEVLETYLRVISKPVITNNRTREKPQVTSQVTFQTATLFISLNIDPDTVLKATVFPLSYDSSKGVLETDKVLIEDIKQVDDDYMSPLLMATKIEFKSYPKEQQIKSFDHNSQEVALFTSSKLTVESVSVTCQYKRASEIQKAVSSFVGLLPNSPEGSKTLSKKVRMGSTIFLQAKSLSCFALFRTIDVSLLNVSEKFGDLKGSIKSACINFYKEGSLQAFIVKCGVSRSYGADQEVLLGITNPEDTNSPLITMRMKEPGLMNVHLRNITLEYYARWLSYFESTTLEETNSESLETTKPTSRFECRVSMSDVVIGLFPVSLLSKGNLIVRKGSADVLVSDKVAIRATLRSISLLLIDDVANILSDADSKRYRQWLNFHNGQTSVPTWTQVSMFLCKGFVTVGSLGSLNIVATISDFKTARDSPGALKALVDLKFNADYCNFDLCADSAQCMLQLFKDLKETITIPFSDKYKTETEAVDVFEGVEMNSFGAHSAMEPDDQARILEDELDLSPQRSNTSLNFVEGYYTEEAERSAKSYQPSERSSVSNNNSSSTNADSKSKNFDFDDAHFESLPVAESRVVPVLFHLITSKVTIRLFDGFDWKATRMAIADAVKRVEKRSAEQERRADFEQGQSDSVEYDQSEYQSEEDEDDEDEDEDDDDRDNYNGVIEERLFESIHVSLPIGANPSSLPSGINREMINDRESTFSADSNQEDSKPSLTLGNSSANKLMLKRSKFHKVLIDASDLEFEMTVFTNTDLADVPKIKPIVFAEDELADDSELINSMQLRVQNFQIVDNVPTSTWNKFVTYMREAGDREVGTSMISLVMNTIKPVKALAATEMVIRASVLPLRLYVDQDTLDFLTRFGEFKDERFIPLYEEDDALFIQMIKVNAVKIKLDYKPKKVDYAGIRSGHTNEFMNFFILDEAKMTLKSIVLYGVPGFPRLNTLLNDSWMPDIKSTQLGGVLAGLAPVKSIVKVGAGFKNLVAIPIKEYEKDGRVMRSIQKGAYSFAKTTGSELLKFGVKLATGTQTILENAEGALGGPGSSSRQGSPGNIVPIPASSRQRRFSDGTGDEEFIYAITDRATFEDQMSSSSAVDFGNRHDIRSSHLNDVDDSDDEDYKVSRNYMPSRPKVRRSSNGYRSYEEAEDEESQKSISLYSNQPNNVQEGLKLAYDSFGKNLSSAKGAITSASSRAAESGSAKTAAYEIARAAPIMVIRPMIGTTEALSKALLGGINNLDPNEKKKSEEKYKRLG